MSIEKFVEEQLKKAVAEGEFDNLPGAGRPVDLDAYFQTPEHLRVGYSMLKGANFVPEEVLMLKEIEAAREQLAACETEARRGQLKRALEEKVLKFRVLVEHNRRAK